MSRVKIAKFLAYYKFGPNLESYYLAITWRMYWISFLCVLIEKPKIKSTGRVRRHRAIIKARRVSNENDSK